MGRSKLVLRTPLAIRGAQIRNCSPLGIAGALELAAGARLASLGRWKLTTRARFASLGRSKLTVQDRFGFARALEIGRSIQ